MLKMQRELAILLIVLGGSSAYPTGQAKDEPQDRLANDDKAALDDTSKSDEFQRKRLRDSGVRARRVPTAGPVCCPAGQANDDPQDRLANDDKAALVTTPDGRLLQGQLDEGGRARFDGLNPGTRRISFPGLDATAWFATVASPRDLPSPPLGSAKEYIPDLPDDDLPEVFDEGEDEAEELA